MIDRASEYWEPRIGAEQLSKYIPHMKCVSSNEMSIQGHENISKSYKTIRIGLKHCLEDNTRQPNDCKSEEETMDYWE